MAVTPRYALRYPDATDPADVPTDMGELALDVENTLYGIVGSFRYRGRLTAAAFAALTGLADGDVVDLIPDAGTSGTLWRFRYNAGGGANKWEFIGGAPLLAFVDTSEARGNAAYGDLATVGPQLTAPRGGDYVVEHGFNAFPNAATAENAWGTVKLGAAAAADTEGAYTWSNAANMAMSSGRTLLRALAANDVVKQMYRTVAGTTVNFRWRFVKLTPVRIS
jgi:hypothetical protein